MHSFSVHTDIRSRSGAAGQAPQYNLGAAGDASFTADFGEHPGHDGSQHTDVLPPESSNDDAFDAIFGPDQGAAEPTTTLLAPPAQQQAHTVSKTTSKDTPAPFADGKDINATAISLG